jgi:hypothetical protein
MLFQSVRAAFGAFIPVLILLCAFSVSGRKLYVTKGGNDDHPGNESAPWATIGKAANTAGAGDTVYIKAGTYAERLIPSNSGSSDHRLVFRAFGNDRVTLDGKGKGGQGVIYLNGLSHVNHSRTQSDKRRRSGYLGDQLFTYPSLRQPHIRGGARNRDTHIMFDVRGRRISSGHGVLNSTTAWGVYISKPAGQRVYNRVFIFIK